MCKTPGVFLFLKSQTVSTSKGTIWPYCAESAIKLQSINQSTACRPYASSLCVMTSASAVAVCDLRRYTSVICLCLKAACPLCLWRTAPLQLQLVVLYTCYAFTFFTFTYSQKCACLCVGNVEGVEQFVGAGDAPHGDERAPAMSAGSADRNGRQRHAIAVLAALGGWC